MKTKRNGRKLLFKKETGVQLDIVEMKSVHGGEDLPVNPPDPLDPPEAVLTDVEYRRRNIAYD